MKAVYLPGDRRVDIREVPIPAVGPGEVLIEVKASCICRSDLSLYYGNPVVGGKQLGNNISGHEPAGVIAKVGQGVRRFGLGDRVAVYLAVGCGVCAYCRMGNFHLCKDWTCLGFTADGGNAEYLVVPERNCLAIPDSMSYIAAAISTDAFGTLFSCCRKLAVSGATTLGIWGLGPMGSSGILAAKALGARVVALDAVMPLGRVAFVGEAAATTIRPSEQLIRKQVTLIGSWYFGIQEYDEIARIIVAKGIDLERLATHRFALDDAETAFRLFDERKTEKAVFVLE